MNTGREAAMAVLRANDRGGYTVPTARLYPFQWNWDSAFVALGWATFDEPRAWREIERLFEGQWADGMLPHIVFHAASDDYFPGPDVWGVTHQPATSGITQPPVVASAVFRLWRAARDAGLAEARTAALYPKLLALHRWWAAARDPQGSGLVAILHPWESGMDNSPAWDLPLARVPAAPVTTIRRRDTGHVAADMRPRDEDYARYVALVDLYRGENWRPEALWRNAPFRVADIGTNAILHRAELDLLALAGRFGAPAERAEIEARLNRARRAIAALWDAGRGLYCCYDTLAAAPIAASTSAGFLPLFSGLPGPQQAARMARQIERWRDKAGAAVPSCDPYDARFEARRYWRGPVWAVVNFMIADGLAVSGIAPLAASIKDDTGRLIETGGFAEYFDPGSGAGAGGGTFSWTAAIALAWAQA